ncbi:MAG: nuclear transport factor 2 family protein [Winogradskyella sp.]|uniref:nuclear transport factor 2 family protein n=1 Tax=Winogradskyella sp. TaxID=1883156 RepID=UPI0017F5F296|nr:nuclear transport factor 2 family protein [Winogradskyella sp.]MBT8245761.1 nuclear transport factor 2 family protein [Winogradskyella sp.]NNK21892.1 nuclear transport factor 2 family protein [Winogradskyella sp.]
MKKYLLTTMTLLVFTISFSQSSEEEFVKQTIIDFFEAFHKQDTVKLKTMAKGNIKMQSISVTKEQKTQLSENDYYGFVKNIAEIPKDKTFEEKLLGFDIKVDGHMANAWTPYEFWFDGNFSHCGVNSFQLVKEDSSWKIIYLVDTRRKKSCGS